jgi:ribosomal-protein-alanine N-acetyltransferase
MDVMETAFGDRFGEAWTRSQCAGILPMAGVSLTVARDGESGGPVGFSLFRHVANESELLLLAVTPSHRRRGIGRGLLHHFLERARSDGATRVHLEVRDGNPAIEMYRSAGFAPIGRRRNYYHASDGRQFDALTFSLDL